MLRLLFCLALLACQKDPPQTQDSPQVAADSAAEGDSDTDTCSGGFTGRSGPSPAR